MQNAIFGKCVMYRSTRGFEILRKLGAVLWPDWVLPTMIDQR